MKKTVFLALIVWGLIASSFAGTSMSQAPANADATAGEKPAIADSEETQLQELQMQLLELTQQRIKTIKNEEVLKDEILALQNKTQNSLSNRVAEEKFLKAQKLLAEIVNEHRASPSAIWAWRMLVVLNSGSVGGSQGLGAGGAVETHLFKNKQ